MHFTPHATFNQNPFCCAIQPNIFSRHTIIQYHTALADKAYSDLLQVPMGMVAATYAFSRPINIVNTFYLKRNDLTLLD
ncbi:hypothetical protein TX23_20830 [Pseudomonas paralactis]|uniref:Uncharacterized protein n=1 Tax=Pseudomonas paralactis TaxID=1615673 RepID=A0A0R3AHN5_9PSED|nr:hypothetical protein TX23_20830 [Pseudomonas paralactis]